MGQVYYTFMESLYPFGNFWSSFMVTACQKGLQINPQNVSFYVPGLERHEGE